ncbi:MAG: EAL domain-containing protein [Rhodospirillales bacterium]
MPLAIAADKPKNDDRAKASDSAADVSLEALPLPIFSAIRMDSSVHLVPGNNRACEITGSAAEIGRPLELAQAFDSGSLENVQKSVVECLSDGLTKQTVCGRLIGAGSETCVLRIARVSTDVAAVVMIPSDSDPSTLAGRDTLAAISHELRTPLNSIIGFAEMMTQEFLGPLGSPEYREYANLIGNAGRNILERFNQETERERLTAIQNQDDYEQIIELAPDMICICVDGCIKKINAAGIAMLGMWDASTLIGRPFNEFVLDDYKDVFSGDMTMLIEENAQVPVKLLRRDKIAIDAEINVLPFERPGGSEIGQNAVILAARDVTERQRSIRNILDREERLRRTMDTVNDAIVVIDETGVIESVNAAASTIFEYSSRELVNRRFETLIDESSSEEGVIDVLKHAALGNTGASAFQVIEMRGRRKGDDTFPLEISVSTMTFDSRRVLIGSIRDISERKAYERELHRMATCDALTGLPNRYLFEQQLDAAIENADRLGGGFSVMSCDLNAFKSINDALGHVFGDKVLRAAAERIKNILDGRGFFAHFGGDDFFILFRSEKNRNDIESIASALCYEMAKALQVEDKEIFTSCTIGICHYPDDAGDRVELMQHVDTVTHYAKKYFAGSYAFYTQPLSEQAQRRLDIERNLRRAIERGEFSVLFQPKVDLMTRDVIGAEALLRWNSRELGVVRPDEFILIAEQTGQIIEIGQWVLDQVCTQGAKWANDGFAPIHLGVNISAVQFLHGDLNHSIRQSLSNTGFDAQLLDLELTESMMVENADRTIEILLELKKMGVTVSMDDFGTGYSALSLLTRFPMDTLKVDRAFVMNLPHDRDAATIAKTIISMAQQLNFSVVAEGIETESQMTFLNALGCDIGQGYLFGKPMTADELSDMIKAA